MNRIIDYLKECDKEMMAKIYVKADWFARELANLSEEEGVAFIEDLCTRECNLRTPEFVVFINKYFDGTIIKELQVASIRDVLDEDINDIIPYEWRFIPPESLLSAVVSCEIEEPDEIERLIILILHSCFLNILKDDIFDSSAENTKVQNDNESEEPSEYLKDSDNASNCEDEEEKILLKQAQKAIEKYNQYCWKRIFERLREELKVLDYRPSV